MFEVSLDKCDAVDRFCSGEQDFVFDHSGSEEECICKYIRDTASKLLTSNPEEMANTAHSYAIRLAILLDLSTGGKVWKSETNKSFPVPQQGEVNVTFTFTNDKNITIPISEEKSDLVMEKVRVYEED